MCRQGMYAQSIPDLKASMVLFSNSIGNQLGTDYPVSVTAPVATALEGTMFIRLFLDQVRDTPTPTRVTAPVPVTGVDVGIGVGV